MRPIMVRLFGKAIHAWSVIVFIVALGALIVALNTGKAQKPQDKTEQAKGGAAAPKSATTKVGLSINDPRAYQGYTLLAPLMSTKAYLIDMQGRVIQTWTANCNPGASTYFLENGHLLRTGTLMGEEQSFGGGPGAGGRVQEFDWDGSLIWDFKLFNPKQLPHHDISRLPNGNVLMIVWDKKTPQECLAAGRHPQLTPDNHLLPDSILEVKPTGKTSGEIVWEWHLWDHLVQDFDKSKANYGSVAEHPELVNVNFGEDVLAVAKTTKDQQEKLKSIGYVGANTSTGRPPRQNPDWTHCNGIAYNPQLDQIILSVHGFSEFWIIDHSTTTKESAGHTGGRYGKGGDLLYRFGNPLAYRAGTKEDQRLFAQHNAQWIAPGLPGAGHVLVFNNGNGRPDGSYSSVDELALPVDAEGRYARDPNGRPEPARLVWSYTAPKKGDFYSFFISGAQRLANGNTLICSGANGTVFEVTPANETVWKYVNPVKGSNPFAPSRPGQLFPSFVRDLLRLSPEQKKQVDELQKEVDAQLSKLFHDEQKKQLKEPPQGGGPGFRGPPPQAGELVSAADQTRLKLSAEQKKQLGEIQKDVDGKLAKILNDEQKKQFKDLKSGQNAMFGRGGPGGLPAAGGPGAPPQLGELVPPLLQERLKMTAEQKKTLGDFQKELTAKLDTLLTEEQKQQVNKPPSGDAGGRGGAGNIRQPGQIMSPAQQGALKLTADQRKQLRALQKQADDKLDKILAADQKQQLKEVRANFSRAGGGANPPRIPGPGGLGGPPQMEIALFRAYRYAASYPGLAGKDLTPGKTIEELQAKEKPKATTR
jgi:hypothetical protein